MLQELFTYTIMGQQGVIYSYDFFMGLAAIAVLALSFYSIHTMKLPFKRSLLCLFAMTLSVPVGARILNVAINPTFYAQNPARVMALETTGFSLMGGLLLAVLVGLISTWLLDISPWRLGDAIAPSLGIGLALMRLGCFLNGCCYGLPSQLPWAVRFPYGSPAHKYYLVQNHTLGGGFSLGQLFGSPALHPTQLYELMVALLAAGLAIYLIKKKTPVGVPCLAASILFTIARLGNHFLRVQPTTNEIPLSFYPIIYIVILMVATILLRSRFKQM